MESKEEEEDYYYEEDKEEEQKEESEEELKNPATYIAKLARQSDAKTKETLMHLAMVNVVKHKDL